MHLAGAVKGDELSCKGKYKAPGSPDWGWRITLDSSGDDGLTMKMFNATPGGQEALAVEAVYTLE